MTPHSLADGQGNSQMLNKSLKSTKQIGQSTKVRKEAKKLQKYDSNSIDEEEFQDCKFIKIPADAIFIQIVRDCF